MKNCLKCGHQILNRVDGKRVSIQRRKFCFDCSPYKAHNTINLIGEYKTLYDNGRKICPKCNLEKDTNEFYMKTDRTVQAYCKKCNTIDVYERMKKFKSKCLEYKGGKCEICGYNKNPNALHFHHKDPSKQKFKISRRRTASFSDSCIKEELDKCILLCANCHAELHATCFDKFKSTIEPRGLEP